MSEGWIDRKERTLANFLVNCSKGIMFMQSIDASLMIKTGRRMFELLDKQVKQVGRENVIQVITDNHSSYVIAVNKYYFLNFYLLLKFELFILRTYVNLLCTMSHKEVLGIKVSTSVLDTMCCTP